MAAVRVCGKVTLGVTNSLDAFAEDSNGSMGALYPDVEALDNTEVLKESLRNTGAGDFLGDYFYRLE